jgi:hypothetical protein
VSRTPAAGRCGTVSFGDAVLEAMCIELALTPAVRWPMVAEARARLERSGPPSDEVLAGMLVPSPAD